MSDTPFVSIIIATFNAAADLPHCLASLEKQRYKDWEVIIMDGASSDGTVDILKNSPIVTQWVSEKDSGIYDAWNKALAKARGTWVCFLGADDAFWDEDALAHEVAATENLPADVGFVYGNCRYMRDGQVTGGKGAPWQDPFVFPRRHTAFKLTMPHPGTLHRRQMFTDLGLFDTRYRIAADYDFMIRAVRLWKTHYIDKPIVAMNVGGVSSDWKMAERVVTETRAVRKAHHLPVSMGLHWQGLKSKIKGLGFKYPAFGRLLRRLRP